MKYRREIDGLRAVAVIPVIFFHAGFKVFKGGFVGVDIFFVISGYLITTIILSDMNNQKFSIVTFYERRARRILPALFFVMLCCLPFAWLWLMPNHLEDFSQSLTAVSAFSSNILFWRESNYFGIVSELKPLLHTWSLAVEEQYYVLFPLFLMALWKFRKRWIFGSLIVVSVVSLMVAQWGAYNNPSAAFYLLPTRGWELAIGALIAFYFLYKTEHVDFIKSHKKTCEVLGFVGLLLICYAIYEFDKNTPFPSLYALIPTIGAGLIIVFSTSETVVGKFLGNKLVVGIGLISYSAYLWHQPLFVFARHVSLAEPGTALLFLLSVLSILLAYISWRFVESPFRDKKKFNTKSIFRFAVIGSLFFAFIGFFGYFNNDLLGGSFNPLNRKINIANYTQSNQVLQISSWDILREVSKDNEYAVENNDYDNKLWFDLLDSKLKLLLVGNSHSKDLFNVLWNSKTAQSMFALSRFGVQIRDLQNNHPMFSSPNYIHSQVVVLVTRFDNNGEDIENLKKVAIRIMEDGKRAVIVKNIFEFPQYREGVWNLLDKITYESWVSGVKNPISIVEESNRTYFEIFQSGKTREAVLSSNLAIEQISEEFPGIIVMDRMDYVCHSQKQVCFSSDYKLNKFFYDYGHHTLEGARYFGKRVDETNWLNPLM